MDTGDILTLIAGLAIVIIIAILANSHYLSGLHVSLTIGTQTVTPTPTPAPTLMPVVTPAPIFVVTPSPHPTDAPLYRIFYTDKPFSYPVYKLPENMGAFGASEIPLRNQEIVEFAFIEDTRGGLTQTFSIPYPVWIINTTVIANRTPQYANFRMALCYANNGTIIEGEEIFNRGTSYRIVQTSNTDMYMIISTRNIDLYRIILGTPRNYYTAYRPY